MRNEQPVPPLPLPLTIVCRHPHASSVTAWSMSFGTTVGRLRSAMSVSPSCPNCGQVKAQHGAVGCISTPSLAAQVRVRTQHGHTSSKRCARKSKAEEPGGPRTRTCTHTMASLYTSQFCAPRSSLMPGCQGWRVWTLCSTPPRAPRLHCYRAPLLNSSQGPSAPLLQAPFAQLLLRPLGSTATGAVREAKREGYERKYAAQGSSPGRCTFAHK